MAGCTVKVSNISPKVTILEIEEFFSFSGQIENINLNRDGEGSQIAYVTFKDQDSLRIALLLSGSAILDKEVNISALPNLGTEELTLEPGADSIEAGGSSALQSRPGVINRAQEIVKAMLSRGFTVGKDAMRRANALDEKSEKAMDGDVLKSMNEISDQKNKDVNVNDVGASEGDSNGGEAKRNTSEEDNEKSSAYDGKSDANGDNNKGSAYDEAVPQALLEGKQSKGGNNNVRASMQKCYRHVCAVNEKLQLGQRTLLALATAQQGVATAGSAVANNKFIAAGGVWVSGALSRVTLKSSNTPPHLNQDGESSPSHYHDVQLTEMTSLSSHKSEED